MKIILVDAWHSWKLKIPKEKNQACFCLEQRNSTRLLSSFKTRMWRKNGFEVHCVIFSPYCKKRKRQSDNLYVLFYTCHVHKKNLHSMINTLMNWNKRYTNLYMHPTFKYMTFKLESVFVVVTIQLVCSFLL